MSKKLKEKYKDENFKNKVMESHSKNKNFFSLSGELLFRNKWIEFGSAYELSFLLWIEVKLEYTDVMRADFYINYQYNDVNKRYYPDFFIYKNFEKILVEIKCTRYPYFNDIKNQAKITSTKEYIKNAGINAYWYIDEDEAAKIGLIFKRNGAISSLCKKLYVEGKINIYSKDKFEKYIGIANEANK